MKSLVLHASSRRTKSLPVRGAWIEIAMETQEFQTMASLPVRGAWIEMPMISANLPTVKVAPRAGSVD